MKVSVTLKGQPDSLGRRRIYLRVNDGFERTFKATNLRIHPKYFDRGKVIGPNAKLFNDKIKEMILQKELSILKGEDVKEKKLFDYINSCLNQWDNTKKFSSLKRHWTEIYKLKRFTNDIPLSKVNLEFLNRYKQFCYDQGNAQNTVWSSLKFLRTIINKAHRERLIFDNPFDLFEFPKYKEVEKIFLSESQVKEIDKICQDKTCQKELRFIGCWFLIGCYTGLRFSDMNSFDKKRIRDGRLVLYMNKTGQPVSIPIEQKVNQLLQLVNFQPLNKTNQYANRIIKEIASLAGIHENVSFHTARHTFATLALTKGLRLETVQKLLGHRNIKDTAVYAKLINPVVDQEYRKMF
jgi:site-specific recombinase XerD